MFIVTDTVSDGALRSMKVAGLLPDPLPASRIGTEKVCIVSLPSESGFD